MNEVDAAAIVTIGAWLRPVAALGAGLLGDRYSVTRMLALSFLFLLASDLFFAFTTPIAGAAGILLGNILIGSTAIFAMRGLVFRVVRGSEGPSHHDWHRSWSCLGRRVYTRHLRSTGRRHHDRRQPRCYGPSTLLRVSLGVCSDRSCGQLNPDAFIASE